MSKEPKSYVVKWTRYRLASTEERYYVGTFERFKAFYGHYSAKTMRGLMSKEQKELDRRYECTFTRAYVEIVTDVPEGVVAVKLL